MNKYSNEISKMGNVELVMISGDKDEKAALKWAKKENFTWPTVLRKDRDIDLIRNLKLRGYPTYVLLDKDGKELARAHGSKSVFKKLKEVNNK